MGTARMVCILGRLLRSGSKQYHHLTGDTPKEVEQMARRLKVKVHGKGHQEPHLDLTPHQAELARKHGAREAGEC